MDLRPGFQDSSLLSPDESPLCLGTARGAAAQPPTNCPRPSFVSVKEGIFSREAGRLLLWLWPAPRAVGGHFPHLLTRRAARTVPERLRGGGRTDARTQDCPAARLRPRGAHRAHTMIPRRGAPRALPAVCLLFPTRRHTTARSAPEPRVPHVHVSTRVSGSLTRPPPPGEPHGDSGCAQSGAARDHFLLNQFTKSLSALGPLVARATPQTLKQRRPFTSANTCRLGAQGGQGQEQVPRHKSAGSEGAPTGFTPRTGRPPAAPEAGTSGW